MVVDLIEFLKDSFTDAESNLIIKKDNEMLQEALYVPVESTILINEILMKESANENHIDIKEYASIIYLHEVGHVLDPDLNDIDTQMTKALKNIYDNGFNERLFNKYAFNSYSAEENAWEIARNLINDDFLENFLKIKKESLNLHKNILKSEKELLKLDNRTSLIFQ
ncbi:hypothetical protein DFR56_103338 [Pseudogracilibacillus auburnensis]|uniref:Uncharacterized protein n=1 Tax=Pseudogracilibacillus auburnensis TaxID=1494959 RepID=A0A2V3W406_9BACI|nr:hypothetical protein DFR56_103338 [Pseudogracilibacillus auburnensis]